MTRITLLLLTLIVLGTAPAAAQETCTLPPRLAVGEAGRTLPDMIVNIRQYPQLGDNQVGRLLPAGHFTVLDGPRCAAGYLWWQVEYLHATRGAVGWAAEGDPASGEYWLEPRGPRTTHIDAEGIPRSTITLPDGTTEPEGCLRPPDDYERVWVDAAQFNRRTLFMIDHASRLYAALGGEMPDFRYLLTQGSYNAGVVEASFGTHDAGGAVDLSVRNPADWQVMTDEMPLMIYALRVAGFAAWVRETGSLYPDSPIHIHAIAIGDAELAPIARQQIDGPGGYLRGLDGLPSDYGGPHPDAHGGPVICGWMVEQGFPDLRDAAG